MNNAIVKNVSLVMAIGVSVFLVFNTIHLRKKNAFYDELQHCGASIGPWSVDMNEATLKKRIASSESCVTEKLQPRYNRVVSPNIVADVQQCLVTQQKCFFLMDAPQFSLCGLEANACFDNVMGAYDLDDYFADFRATNVR